MKDIEKSKEFPNASKDRNGRLLAAAAIGVGVDMLDRVKSLVDKGLDILFIDKTGIITRIVERAVPHSLATISSRGKVLAVLELKGGLTSRLDIKRGDKVSHPAFN